MGNASGGASRLVDFLLVVDRLMNTTQEEGDQEICAEVEIGDAVHLITTWPSQPIPYEWPADPAGQIETFRCSFWTCRDTSAWLAEAQSRRAAESGTAAAAVAEIAAALAFSPQEGSHRDLDRGEGATFLGEVFVPSASLEVSFRHRPAATQIWLGLPESSMKFAEHLPSLEEAHQLFGESLQAASCHRSAKVCLTLAAIDRSQHPGLGAGHPGATAMHPLHFVRSPESPFPGPPITPRVPDGVESPSSQPSQQMRSMSTASTGQDGTMDWYSRDRREERPAEGGAEDQAPLAVPDEPVLAEIAEGVPPNSAEAMFVDALAAPAMKLMMHSSDIIRGLSHGCNVAERDLAITRREYSSKEAIYKGQLATLLGNKRDLKDRLSLIRLAICERWSSSETLANMQRLFAAWRAWALQPSGGALLMQEASEDLCLIVMVMYTWKGQVLKSREADTYSAARAEINRQHGAYTRWVLSVAEAFEASTLRSAMTAWSLEAMLLKGNRLAAESRLEDERRHDHRMDMAMVWVDGTQDTMVLQDIIFAWHHHCGVESTKRKLLAQSLGILALATGGRSAPTLQAAFSAWAREAPRSAASRKFSEANAEASRHLESEVRQRKLDAAETALGFGGGGAIDSGTAFLTLSACFDKWWMDVLRCREADAQASMAAMAKRFRNSMLQNIGALVERGTTEADAAVVGEAFRAWSAEVSAAKAPEAGAETAEEAEQRRVRERGDLLALATRSIGMKQRAEDEMLAALALQRWALELERVRASDAHAAASSQLKAQRAEHRSETAAAVRQLVDRCDESADMIRATLIMRAWFDEVTKARNELPPPPPHFQRAPVVLALDRVAARWSDTDAFLLKALVIHKWSQLALRTRESDAHAAAVAILQKEQETCKERAVAAVLQVEQETDIALLQKTFLCWATDVRDSKQAEQWRGEQAAMISEVEAMAEQRIAGVLQALDQREAAERVRLCKAAFTSWRGEALKRKEVEHLRDDIARLRDRTRSIVEGIFDAASPRSSGILLAFALALWQAEAEKARELKECARYAVERLEQADGAMKHRDEQTLVQATFSNWKQLVASARFDAQLETERAQWLVRADGALQGAFRAVGDDAIATQQQQLQVCFLSWRSDVLATRGEALATRNESLATRLSEKEAEADRLRAREFARLQQTDAALVSVALGGLLSTSFVAWRGRAAHVKQRQAKAASSASDAASRLAFSAWACWTMSKLHEREVQTLADREVDRLRVADAAYSLGAQQGQLCVTMAAWREAALHARYESMRLNWALRADQRTEHAEAALEELQKMVPAQVAFSAWRGVHLSERAERMKEHRLLHSDRRLQQLDAAWLASYTDGMQRFAFSLWRDAVVHDRQARNEAKWAALADSRLAMLDATYLSAQVDLPLRVAFAAWREAASSGMTEQVLDNMMKRADVRVEKAEAALLMSNREACRYLVFLAWQKAVVELKSERSNEETRQQIEQRLKQAEKARLSGVEKAEAALLLSNQEACRYLVFVTWQKAAVELKSERSNEQTRQQVEQAERARLSGVEKAEAALLMSNREACRYLVFVTWQKAAVELKFERSNEEIRQLVEQVERARLSGVEKAEAALLMSNTEACRYLVFVTWQKAVVELKSERSNEETRQQIEQAERARCSGVEKAEAALLMSNRDACRYLVFVTWQKAAVELKSERSNEETHQQVEQRLKQAERARLSGVEKAEAALLMSNREACRFLVFVAWRKEAAERESERIHEELRQRADQRLKQADSALLRAVDGLQGDMLTALLCAAFAMWAAEATISRVSREREAVMIVGHERLRQAETIAADRVGDADWCMTLTVFAQWRRMAEQTAMRAAATPEDAALLSASLIVAFAAWARETAIAKAARTTAACLQQVDRMLVSGSQDACQYLVLTAWRRMAVESQLDRKHEEVHTRSDDRLRQAEAALLAHARCIPTYLCSQAFEAWRSAAATRAQTRRAGERTLRAAEALHGDMLTALTCAAFAVWAGEAELARTAKTHKEALSFTNRRLDFVCDANTSLQQQGAFLMCMSAWKEFARFERLSREQHSASLAAGDERLRQADTIAASGQRVASLRTALRAWQDVVVGAKMERDQEHLLFVADQRLGQADTALEAGQRVALQRIAFAAWRDALACCLHERQVEQWCLKSESRLQQAYMLCSAAGSDAVLAVTLAAWKDAYLQALRLNERAAGLLRVERCTEHAYERAMLLSEEAALRLMWATWREEASAARRAREASELLASSDGAAERARRSWEQIQAIVVKASQQCEEALPRQMCFTAWKEEALLVKLQRCEEDMLLREDAHLAHVDRSLAIEEALLVMAQGGLPQHLVLSAWRDAAVVGRHERERVELQVCAERLLQDAHAREDLRSAFDSWWRGAVVSKVHSTRHSEAVDAAHNATQDDLCRFIVLTAWRQAALSGAQQQWKRCANRRLQLAVLLSNRPDAVLSPIFSSWRGVVADARAERDKEERLLHSDRRLQLADAAWLASFQDGLLRLAYTAWRDVILHERRTRNEEQLTHLASKRTQQLESTVFISQVQIPLRATFSAWQTAMLLAGHERILENMMRRADRHMAQANIALLAALTDAPKRVAFSSWACLTLACLHDKEVQKWVAHGDQRLEVSEAAYALGMRKACLRATMSAWKEALLHARYEALRLNWALRADQRSEHADAILEVIQRRVPLMATLIAWWGVIQWERTEREKDWWRRCAERRLQQAELLASGPDVVLNIVMSNWREVVVNARVEREKEHRLLHSDRRLQQADAAWLATFTDGIQRLAFSAWRDAVLHERRARFEAKWANLSSKRLAQVDAAWMIAQGDLPVRVTFVAWQKQALVSLHEREKETLLRRADRHREQVYDGDWCMTLSAFLQWRRVAVRGLRNSAAAPDSASPSAPLIVAFTAWARISAMATAVRNAGPGLQQVESVLLSNSREASIYFAFSAWSQFTLECRSERKQQQLRSRSDLRLEQAESALASYARSDAANLTSSVLDGWRAVARERARTRLAGERTLRAAQAVCCDMAVALMSAAFAVWAGEASIARAARQHEELLTFANRRVDFVCGANSSLQQQGACLVCLAAWRELLRFERVAKEREAVVLAGEERLRQADTIAASGQRAASLRASMRAWRDILVALKAEQDQERCLLIADQRLQQADSVLIAGQRIALERLVLAAWRGGQSAALQDRACDRWRARSEQHLQQAYAMCGASTTEALLGVVLMAWKEALWQALRRRERRLGLLQMDLCTEHAFEQAVQYAEETTLHFLFATWKEAVATRNRERETSRLLASTDGLADRARRLSQQVQAVAGSAARQEEQVPALMCFNIWRVEALQAKAQRCQEEMAQRDEATAAQAKRGVELTEALLVMTDGDWPRHIILTAWKHVANLGAYERKRQELQTCAERLLQDGQAREDLHAVFDGWWRALVVSKVGSERYLDAVDSAMYVGQKDACRFVVFVAWRHACVTGAQEANMQRIRMALSLHKATNRSPASHMLPATAASPAAQGSPQSATPLSVGSSLSPMKSPFRFRQPERDEAPKSPTAAGMTPATPTVQPPASSKSDLLMRVLRAEGNFMKAKGTALRRQQEAFQIWLLGLSLRAWAVDTARSMAEKAAKRAAATDGEADLKSAQEAAAAFQEQLRIAQEQLAARKRLTEASGRQFELCFSKSDQLADGAFAFAAFVTWRAAAVEEKAGEKMKVMRSETAAPKDGTVSKAGGSESNVRAKPLLDRVEAARSEILIAVVVRAWHEEAKENREAKIKERARNATERLAQDLYLRQDLALLCVLFAFWRDYVNEQARLDALAAEAWHTRLALQGDLDAIQEECQMTGLQLDELEAEFFSLQAQLTKHPVPPAVLAALAGIQAPAALEDTKERSVESRPVETQTEAQLKAREEEAAVLRSECVLQRGKIDDLERELELLEAHLVGSHMQSKALPAARPAGA